MSKKLLEIKNLHASINGKEILKGINLSINEGEIHAIMGPNGSGKSTLSSVLVGNPAFEVTEGEVTFRGENILPLSPEERSHRGLFLSFQYPVEIPGVSMVNFMKAAINEKRKSQGLPPMPAAEFLKLMKEKREFVQLDETDSGLDIDALRIVAEGVNKLHTPETSSIVITHYQRLLDYIKPQFVHVLYNGRIVKDGGSELALELEKRGYDWIKEQHTL